MRTSITIGISIYLSFIKKGSALSPSVDTIINVPTLSKEHRSVTVCSYSRISNYSFKERSSDTVCNYHPIIIFHSKERSFGTNIPSFLHQSFFFSTKQYIFILLLKKTTQQNGKHLHPIVRPVHFRRKWQSTPYSKST